MNHPSISLDRMKRFIETYYMWNRVPVGMETSKFARQVAEELKADLISVPSGNTCLTWVIPPAWEVREAYLSTLDGHHIANFQWHPLYLKSYSVPYSGEVSREELLKHVLTDPNRPDCIVFDYRAQYQFNERTEWGFSLPYNVVQSLQENRYFVHIDTEFETGKLDVVDCILPGKQKDTILIGAHTCHQGQVNDGIACIAVAVELFRWLQQHSQRKYTYRFVFGPEYYAAAALLHQGRDIENIRYGIYLDMLGNRQRIGFSKSFRGDTYLDRIVENVLASHTDDYLVKDYRDLWGNDEMFYDGPDFEIPMVGLGREYFSYYHTDRDNLEYCDINQLEESLNILQKITDIFETDCVAKRLYQGPLYLSKYKLYIDPNKNRKGARSLQAIQILMNGKTSCLHIADRLGIEYEFVRSFADALYQHGLAQYVE